MKLSGCSRSPLPLTGLVKLEQFDLAPDLAEDADTIAELVSLGLVFLSVVHLFLGSGSHGTRHVQS
jgi:hypothetical protein